MNGAQNRVAAAEDLTDKELEDLHKELQRRAQRTLGTLEARRTKKAS